MTASTRHLRWLTAMASSTSPRRFIKAALRTVLVVRLGASASALTGHQPQQSGEGIHSASGRSAVEARRQACAPDRSARGSAPATPLRIRAVALATLVFVLWRRPTVTVVALIAVLLLVLLGLIELIGSSTRHGGTSSG